MLAYSVTFFCHDCRMGSPSLTRSSHGKPAAELKGRLRLFFWGALVALIVGVTEFGAPIENLMRDIRNVARSTPASDRLLIVAIDDRSIEALKSWPWRRSHYANIIDRLSVLGPKSISLDIDFSSTSTPIEDERLSRALSRQSPRVVLPVQVVVDPTTGSNVDLVPVASLRREADLASIDALHNFRGEVRSLPYSFRVAGQAHPSMGARVAGASGGVGEMFPIDYAIDPRSIPTVSAIDVLKGTIPAERVAGKSIIIGATSAQLGDKFSLPRHGVLPGLYLQALGAETLWRGRPLVVGWFPPSLLALALFSALIFIRDVRLGAMCGGAAILGLVTIPVVLEERGIVADIVPSLVFGLAVTGALAWWALKHLYRARGNRHAVSGLPNLNALREDAAGQKLVLVVAKVHNYPEIASALAPDVEAALIQQIARRLQLISSASRLYQGDDGLFAWFAKPEAAPLPDEHLKALYRIFRGPMVAGDSQIDVAVTFGVDRQHEEPLAGRLSGALTAADEAMKEGLEWKSYDPSRHENTAWKLTLLSQLDRAIDNGDLWVAFQPKLDLATDRIIGAEALARWDHPERGAVSPADFVLAAEQSGRIGKLTDYVLSHSIAAAALLNEGGDGINIAVNLSARLINGIRLTETVSALLAKYRIPGSCLTLEITETAALAGAGRDLEILKELRGMGVKLSIDDYGTGLSTLDYMKRIPASEIKIDKSFIQAIDRSRSDRLMVHSTIQLAHSLGQKVVAEGVERTETLEILKQLGCDIAQGYLIGRPEPLDALERRVTDQRRAA